MCEVITFTSGKGGVGKTTTTANVGVGLSLLDKKVVLVDTDIGLRNLDVIMGLENRIMYNLVDVLTGRCRLKQALIRDKRYPNLYIIPSACTKESVPLTKIQMQNLITELRKDFDYVLIDSPAGIDAGFELAIADTDKIIVVTTPQVAAVHDADCVLRILRKRKFEKTYLLVNAYQKHLVKEGNMLQVIDIASLLGAEIIGIVLDDTNIIISQNHGESIYGKKTIAEPCYQNICRRLIGEDIPIPDFSGNKHFFSHIFLKKDSKRRTLA